MAVRRPLDVPAELLEAFAHALRVSEYLVGAVPKQAWHAEPITPGRTIGQIVYHMHGLRRTFANMAAGTDLVPKLIPTGGTPAQARAALVKSRKALVAVLGEALAQGKGRVGKLPRRVVNMMAYLMQHDAHHRGQITRQVRELGFALPDESSMLIWGWRKLPGRG